MVPCNTPFLRPRLSAIEVHPEFSEAPHFLRSSIPDPKTAFSKKRRNPVNNLTGLSKYSKMSLIKIKIGIPTILG